MERPRLKTTTEVLSSPGGDICLLRPSADSDLVIEGAGERDRELVARLDGRSPRRARGRVRRRRGGAELLELLDCGGARGGRGRIRRAHRAGARALRPPAALLRRPGARRAVGAGCQLTAAELSVVVLGVGGLGTWTRSASPAAGVGRLTLVDGDTSSSATSTARSCTRRTTSAGPKAAVAAAAHRALQPRGARRAA